jgi:hydrogenase expression/formation protein HypC
MCLGVPGRIVEIADAQEQRAIAEVEGVRREISVALLGVATADGTVVAPGDATGLEAVSVGDWVLIHVGFAMSRIDEDEAQETLRALKLFSGAFEEELLEFGADGPLDPLAVLRPEPTPGPQAGEPR